MADSEIKTQDDIFNNILNTPEEETEEEEPGYTVFNYTDGFFASPDTFKTPKAAKEFIVNFRNQYRKQGYYSTSDRTRISPDEIELEVLPPNFQF